jgi:hypothetical protein
MFQICPVINFEYSNLEKMEAQNSKAESTFSFGEDVLNAAMEASSDLCQEKSKEKYENCYS